MYCAYPVGCCCGFARYGPYDCPDATRYCTPLAWYSSYLRDRSCPMFSERYVGGSSSSRVSTTIEDPWGMFCWIQSYAIRVVSTRPISLSNRIDAYAGWASAAAVSAAISAARG